MMKHRYWGKTKRNILSENLYSPRPVETAMSLARVWTISREVTLLIVHYVIFRREALFCVTSDLSYPSELVTHFPLYGVRLNIQNNYNRTGFYKEIVIVYRNPRGSYFINNRGKPSGNSSNRKVGLIALFCYQNQLKRTLFPFRRKLSTRQHTQKRSAP